MYRIVALVLLVAGLMLVVGDLSAERPPIRDTRIPIYLGDPDGVEFSRGTHRSGEADERGSGILAYQRLGPCAEFLYLRVAAVGLELMVKVGGRDRSGTAFIPNEPRIR